MHKHKNSILIALACGLFLAIQQSSIWAQSGMSAAGVFEGHDDVGTILHAGSVDYDSLKHTYTVTGSGENMWSVADAFQFAWKKVSGDVTLTADVAFANAGGNEHKKAVLVLRQSLDPDSVYADVALHASGLTSLQFREEKGGITREIQSNFAKPQRLRIAASHRWRVAGCEFRCRERSMWGSEFARTIKMP
jgi:hypothetical protein